MSRSMSRSMSRRNTHEGETLATLIPINDHIKTELEVRTDMMKRFETLEEFEE